jgi:hypothetical protein
MPKYFNLSFGFWNSTGKFVTPVLCFGVAGLESLEVVDAAVLDSLVVFGVPGLDNLEVFGVVGLNSLEVFGVAVWIV